MVYVLISFKSRLNYLRFKCIIFICMLSNSFWFKFQNVAFEAKVLNRYDTFDQIANKNMEDPSYAYLLDKVALTTITLRVKSPHVEM